MKATWKGAVLAESEDTVLVEGNHYFPEAALRREHFRASATHSVCPWKGTASYYDIVVGADVNRDAAWYYPTPKPAAANITGRVAFWKGVEVLAFAALLLLAAHPAGALEDLSGTWQGKISCDVIDGGFVTHISAEATVYMDDGGTGSVGVSVQTVGNFFGRYGVDVGDADHAVVQGASCGFDEADVEGAVLHADVKTKAGSTKASFSGTLIVLDGPGGSTSRCDLKLKRTSLQAPTPLCF